MGLTGSTHLNHAVVLYTEARATQRAQELQNERESKAAKRRRRRRKGKCRTTSYIPHPTRAPGAFNPGDADAPSEMAKRAPRLAHGQEG